MIIIQQVSDPRRMFGSSENRCQASSRSSSVFRRRDTSLLWSWRLVKPGDLHQWIPRKLFKLMSGPPLRPTAGISSTASLAFPLPSSVTCN